MTVLRLDGAWDLKCDGILEVPRLDAAVLLKPVTAKPVGGIMPSMCVRELSPIGVCAVGLRAVLPGTECPADPYLIERACPESVRAVSDVISFAPRDPSNLPLFEVVWAVEPVLLGGILELKGCFEGFRDALKGCLEGFEECDTEEGWCNGFLEASRCLGLDDEAPGPFAGRTV